MRSRLDPGPRRLSDVAYDQICDEIVRSDLLPGTALSEKELAERLGVGLTPIRDALKRLSLEGLVMTYPRRGTFVAEINVADEQWITEVRVELEGLCASLAAHRSLPQDHDRLVELQQVASAHPLDDPHGYFQVESVLRQAIYDAAKNPYVRVTAQFYSQKAMRIWHHGVRENLMRLVTRCNQSLVIDAIVAGDAEAARRHAQEQVLSFAATSDSEGGVRFQRGYGSGGYLGRSLSAAAPAATNIEFP